METTFAWLQILDPLLNLLADFVTGLLSWLLFLGEVLVLRFCALMSIKHLFKMVWQL
jgi:hypothetical protein